MPGGTVVEALDVRAGEVDGDHVPVVRRRGLRARRPQGPVVRVERWAGDRGRRGLGDRVGADSRLELAEEHRAAARVAGVVDGDGTLDGESPSGRCSHWTGCRWRTPSGWSQSWARRTGCSTGRPRGSSRPRRRICETIAIARITAAVPATAPPTAYSQLRRLLLPVVILDSLLRVRERIAIRPSPGSTSETASEISSDRRASWWGSSRGSSVTGCLQMVGEQVAQRGRAARGVALDRAPADAEGLGDLGLGEVDVVTQGSTSRWRRGSSASASSTAARRLASSSASSAPRVVTAGAVAARRAPGPP